MSPRALATLVFHILNTFLFRGRTQVAAGSRTVLGIGPGPCYLIVAFLPMILRYLPQARPG